MLRLIVEEKDRVVQAASIPVRWCVSKETFEELKRYQAINPHILIVTVAGGEEMTRQLVQLERMMTYVQFARPGKNRIFARIVWADSGKHGDLWDKYFRQIGGGYSTTIIDRYSTTIIDHEGRMFGSRSNELETAEMGVVVPEELFAKKPPEWESQWVNLFFSGMAEDQCEYRERRLFAYTLQPAWFALRFIAGVIAVVIIVLCGKGGANLRPIISPYSDFEDIWENVRRSILKRTWFDGNYTRRQLFFSLPLAPIFLICFFTFTCILSYKNEGNVMWDVAAVGTIMVTVCLMAIGGLVDGVRFLFSYLGKKGKQTEKRRLAELKYEELEPLICDGGDLKAKINDLPLERRTINLRFLDLKANVCKPFAR